MLYNVGIEDYFKFPGPIWTRFPFKIFTGTLETILANFNEKEKKLYKNFLLLQSLKNRFRNQIKILFIWK